MALIQLPLGLNLPVGAKLQVDDGKAVDVVNSIRPRPSRAGLVMAALRPRPALLCILDG